MMREKDNLHDEKAVERFRRAHRVDPDAIRRFRFALYHLQEPMASALRRLGPAAAHLEEWFCLTPIRIEQRHDSTLDESQKFVLALEDNRRVEAVLIRATKARTTACLSTQVGCDAGCPFCATARMHRQRDLTVAEIVEQFLILARQARAAGRRVRNIVFMGMGEPCDNFDALCGAIETFVEPQGCRFPLRRITVSTIGIPDRMVQLVDRFPGIHLAVSLHSAIPALRDKLVPWNRRYTIGALRKALGEIASRPRTHRQQGPVMIEYVMIEGINDRDEDAKALIEFLKPLTVCINLIPLNPIPQAPHWRPTPRARRDAFAQQLRQAGFFTTIRYSMGADVNAACGQLLQTTQTGA